MKSEWREIELQAVADEITVGHVGSMASEYVESGIPFLRSLNVEPFRVNETDIKYITPEFHARLKKSTLRPGDVVIVRTGKPGSTALIPARFAEANCSDLVIVRPGKNLDRRFLVYVMNSVAQRHIAAHLVGAVQQHFNVGSARTLKINLPPLPEQQAIACILGALDDKIELNRRRNRTLEAMARAIFQSWFVDFDPVKAKAAGRPPEGLTPDIAALFPDALEDSPLGKIPRGWRVGKVRELCAKVENGGTPKRQVEAYWTPAQVPWLTSGEVRQPFVVETENFISKSGFESSSAKMWPPFTTVVALYGATAGIATVLGIELCANQACCGLVPKAQAACFIHQLLSVSLAALQQQTRGSAQQNLSQSIVADLQCLIPTFELLQAYENRVDCIYQRCIASIQESRTLAALRDTLLPKLISGELRVPYAEQIVKQAT